ncbi:DMT family transporter [Desulfobulbus elongatus]|uniref:DMT family transporter n=1 Tax=Desulfobulbus elongatus TaxID=53332 RepID=UPI0006857D28|nr:DMT family transporter [Desulfobulbus elongatus]
MQSIKPVLAALTMVFIWSGWITLSRHGVHTELQPADITLLRYWTALLTVAPFALRYPWRRFRLWQHLVVGLGVGFPYTMLSFYGLKVLRAAHAGVVVNGMLPVLGAVAAWLLFRQRLAPHRYAAISLIFAANIVMTGGSIFALDRMTGIALLLAAAVCYTGHMTGIRLCGMNWQDVVVIVPVVNVAIFTPLWYLFPTGFARASLQDMAVQAVYQGVVVNVLALICVAYAIRHLGTMTVSLFMSFVPVTTALLAWLLLGEALNPWELAGIFGCSLGLLWYAREPRSRALTAKPTAGAKRE